MGHLHPGANEKTHPGAEGASEPGGKSRESSYINGSEACLEIHLFLEQT